MNLVVLEKMRYDSLVFYMLPLNNKLGYVPVSCFRLVFVSFSVSPIFVYKQAYKGFQFTAMVLN